MLVLWHHICDLGLHLLIDRIWVNQQQDEGWNVLSLIPWLYPVVYKICILMICTMWTNSHQIHRCTDDIQQKACLTSQPCEMHGFCAAKKHQLSRTAWLHREADGTNSDIRDTDHVCTVCWLLIFPWSCFKKTFLVSFSEECRNLATSRKWSGSSLSSTVEVNF